MLLLLKPRWLDISINYILTIYWYNTAHFHSSATTVNFNTIMVNCSLDYYLVYGIYTYVM